LLLSLTRQAGRRDLEARVVTFVAIYSAVGLRDHALSARIGIALTSNPLLAINRLRRDAHEPSVSCWLHAANCCLSLQQ